MRHHMADVAGQQAFCLQAPQDSIQRPNRTGNNTPKKPKSKPSPAIAAPLRYLIRTKKTVCLFVSFLIVSSCFSFLINI